MPAVFEKFGVRVLYPENWDLIDVDGESTPLCFTLQSKETAYWTLYIYPPGHEVRPKVKEIVEGLQAEYKEVEVIPVEEEIGETKTKGVDLAFFYLDLLVEAKIRTLRTPSATLIWHYMAESREFEEREPVFKAIATTLLQTQVALPE
ncbi:hypothetical protein [Anatilimnocola floriformis]|uniref:hypothetical protein n=1 Tax=Anatilimnocola floriformis TaxID=2948575 RepID=UPI0020C44C61|nr:hypothetical protein [Anatilimnocola floriformis]